jgi:hypothetical protein
MTEFKNGDVVWIATYGAETTFKYVGIHPTRSGESIIMDQHEEVFECQTSAIFKKTVKRWVNFYGAVNGRIRSSPNFYTSFEHAESGYVEALEGFPYLFTARVEV